MGEETICEFVYRQASGIRNLLCFSLIGDGCQPIFPRFAKFCGKDQEHSRSADVVIVGEALRLLRPESLK
jgi:hypothetical protein